MIGRFLVLLLWIGVPLVGHAQTLLASGGVARTSDTEVRDVPALSSAFQIGGRIWLTDLFQLQGSLVHQSALAAEVSLHARPLLRERLLDPYLFIGLGHYLTGEAEQAVVPLGVGLEYHLGPQWSLLFELTNRWTRLDLGEGNHQLVTDVRPTLGIAFDLGWQRRPFFSGERQEQPARNPRPAVAAAETEPVAPADTVRKGGAADPLPEADNMMLVPDGTFILGLTDEDPLQLQTAGMRRITVSGFYIDKYEVTNADYRRFLSELPPDQRAAMLPDTTMGQQTGNRFSWSDYLRGAAFDTYPVVGVTHAQAEQYCAFYEKRLPTEAEWEYAARSGEIGGIYPWDGLDPRDEAGHFLANYNPGRGGYASDGYAFTAPVDAFPPSAWGLYQMSGNVAEWCQDAYHPSYSALADFNPMHRDTNESRRIIRGGSWASDAFYIGVGVRDALPADTASPYVGFRCVQDVSDAQPNK